MFERTVSADDLARLKRAREEADRAYNEALTVLDGALPKPPVLPRPPAGDNDRFAALRAGGQLDTGGGTAPGTGWRGRLRAVVWRIVGPIVTRQEHFNALVVEHLERAAAAEAAQRVAADAVVHALDGHLEAVTTFHSRLLQYLQQITPYVDTKDREASGLARRITEDVAERTDAVDRRQQTLAGLDTTVAHLQHEVLAIRHSASQAAASAPSPTDSHAATAAPPAPPSTPESIDASVDAYSYVGFEDRYRGAWEAIRERQREYVPLFEGASDVLDIGCGRGEFLDLLREAGITATGVDANPQMVEACRGRDLTATTGDALEFLEALPDGALGGLFSAQVVEHLPPDTLVRLIRVAWRKLRPGSTIAIETINPSCWLAFFETYLRDFTHVKPLHPETLRYLLAASGFHDPAIRFQSPVSETDRLQRLPLPDPAAGAPVDTRLIACLRAVNHNVERLNSLLFSSMDYAAIATRP
jgi:O-antigen chain-terminating methyltransferase